MEEDAELKDLIIQKALAPNGTLAKIKVALHNIRSNRLIVNISFIGTTTSKHIPGVIGR